MDDISFYLHYSSEYQLLEYGYPTTKTPTVHENLKHANQWKTFKSKKGEQILSFLWAKEGVDLVQKESVEMFQTLMLHWFSKFPELVEQFKWKKHKLPTNLLAVSFSINSFEVGDSCQYFKLCKGFKQPDGAFYSWRKMSESLQYCFYNEDGVEYLAGVTFCPPQHEINPVLRSNKFLLEHLYPIPYPPQDRQQSYSYTKSKRYTRYCTSARKYVLVDFNVTSNPSRYENFPVHYKYDHFAGYIRKDPCPMCRLDFENYKWEGPKKEFPSKEEEAEIKRIEKGYSTTRTPFDHENLNHAVKFEKFEQVGLLYAKEGVDVVQKSSLEMIRKQMLERVINIPGLADYFKETLPTNLLAVSFSMDNFVLGDTCQHFELSKEFEQSKGAFFSWRKQTENLQFCFYNEDGVEYLAGVTYYPPLYGKTTLLASNNALLEHIYPIPYPPQDRRETNPYKDERKCYTRFCKTAGKYVLNCWRLPDGRPRQCDFNHRTKTWVYTLCDECVEEHKTYTWEEPGKESSASSDPATGPEAPSTPESSATSVPVSPSTAAESPSTPESTPEPSSSATSDSVSPSTPESSDDFIDDFEKIDINGDGEIVE